MTQEQKAKAYDKAIDRAKKYHFRGAKQCIIDILEYLFPQLKESEDEKFKKDIVEAVEFHKDFTQDKKEQIYTWLKRQGDANKEYWRGYREGKQEVLDKYTELEKQSGQKSADNVKPKFHEGEWVVSKYMHLVMQILSNDNGYYKTVETDGTERNDSYDFIERNFKPWTIQDVKDGDVISNGKMIVIFKHFEEPSYKQHIVAYIGLDKNGNIQITADTWQLGIDKAKPATKEQCDLLFSKMKEMGYEWDAKKKELKEIHVIDEGKSEIDHCFTKMMNGENVSSAWGEEDKSKVQRICKYLNEAKKYYADITEVRECIEWLNTLEKRVKGD